MNEPINRTLEEIAENIDTAYARRNRRDQLSWRIDRIGKELASLQQQTTTLEQQAITSKQTYDQVRRRVWPILRGWLNGRGAPKNQEIIAQQKWRTAEETLTKHLQQIAQLEQELSEANNEASSLVTAEQELAQVLKNRDQWLIKWSHHPEITQLQKLITEIESIEKNRAFYKDTVTSGWEVVSILCLARQHVEWSGAKFGDRLTKTSSEPEASIRYFGQLPLDITQKLSRYKENLRQLGVPLIPEPHIDWDTFITIEQASRKLEEEEERIEQHLSQIGQHVHIPINHLKNLKKQYDALSEILWEDALTSS